MASADNNGRQVHSCGSIEAGITTAFDSAHQLARRAMVNGLFLWLRPDVLASRASTNPSAWRVVAWRAFLKQGVGLWKVGERTAVVKHILSSVERPLVNTDSRIKIIAGVDDISDAEWDSLLEQYAAGDAA